MRNRFTNFGWVVTLLIVLIPITIWLTTQPTQWPNVRVVLENLAKMAGLAGLSLFAWNVILSARLKLYDRLFMGLDNTYRAHHLIGCITIILLMIHPLLLAWGYFITSPVAAMEFLKPSLASPFKILGTLTLSLMMITMFVVLFIKVQYRRFILLQRLLGLLLFLGGIHAIFVGGSDINQIVLLQFYIFILLGLAAGVYIYRSIFHKGFHKFYDYKLDVVTPRGEVIELCLSTSGDSIKQKPGQFVFVKFDTPGVLGESHPFTVSAPPQAGKLRFSIKNLGDYTAAIQNIQPGLTAKIDGPYGTFSNTIIKNPRQIWVAGGIGITPFLAMAGALGGDQQIDLYYSVKNAQEAVYLEELQHLAKGKANLVLHPYYTEKSGLLTADYIFKASQNRKGAAYLVCGPPGMMKALKNQLVSGGVARHNVHTEEFGLK